MQVTEKEASEIACPFAKSFNASRTDTVRLEDSNGFSSHGKPTCIGHKCMAWEWLGLDYEVLAWSLANGPNNEDFKYIYGSEDGQLPSFKYNTSVEEMEEARALWDARAVERGWEKQPQANNMTGMRYRRKVPNENRIGECRRSIGVHNE